MSVRTVLLLALGLGMYGCGGDDDDNGTPGASGGVAGSLPTAGAKSGGAPPATSGGKSTAGTGGTAGAKTGGASSGGKATAGGGTQSGGASSGGTATAGGGAQSGGAETAGGGAESGGAESGGAESGGAETAGAGGEATGGAATAGAGGEESGGAATAGAGGEESGGAATAGAGGEESGGAATAGAGGEATGGAATAGAGGEATGGAANAGAGGEGGTAAFCAGSTALFCDDFEDGNSAGWAAVNTSSSTPGNWAVATDTGNDGNSTLDFQETDVNTPGGNYHWQVASGAGVGPWTDQTVTAWIKLTTPVSTDLNKVGICARMTGTNNNSLVGYCLFLRTDTSGAGQLQLSRKALNLVDGGSATVFNTVSGTSNPSGGTIPSFSVGNWYKVALKVADVSGGVQITGYVNDVALITVTDGGVFDDAGVATANPVTSAGFAAVVTRSNPASDGGVIATAANFDNVTVTSP
jgi:hypothetical protein